MMKILIDDLVYKWPKIKIWQLHHYEPNKIELVFHDKSVVMSRGQVILSSYYYIMFQTFPGVPITSDFRIDEFTADTHLMMCEKLIWHIYYALINANTPVPLWYITMAAYEVTNIVYNMSCVELSEYVTGATLGDMVEILEEPELVAAKLEYQRVVEETDANEIQTTKAIANVYEVLKGILYTNKEHLKNNGIKKLTMSKLVNMGQMLQLLGTRGYVRDIDDSVFKYPVIPSYAEGLTTLYDSMVASREACTADLMTEEPLQNSEYFNRKMQEAAMVVLGYVDIPGGCTGYRTVPYLVANNDMQLLKGKYHMVDGNPEPELIWDTIEPLVNRIIYIRSITGCGYHDPQYVCTTCLGWSHIIRPSHRNLGYNMVTPLNAKISQWLLSLKHHIASAPSKIIELDKTTQQWLRIDHRDNSKLLLSDKAAKGKTLLRINSEYVFGLSLISQIDVSILPGNRISKIPDVDIVSIGKNGEILSTFDTLKLSVSNVGVFLSYEMLEYLKKNSWETGTGYVDIYLDSWNPKHPLFIVPKRGESVVTFFNDIKNFLEGGEKSACGVSKIKTVSKAMSTLIDIVRTNITDINLVQIEIYIRSLMVVNYQNGEYQLPTGQEPYEFVNLKKIISCRTLSGMLAFEQQHRYMTEPHWVNNPQKTIHPLDSIISNDYAD